MYIRSTIHLSAAAEEAHGSTHGAHSGSWKKKQPQPMIKCSNCETTHDKTCTPPEHFHTRHPRWKTEAIWTTYPFVPGSFSSADPFTEVMATR